MSAKGVEYSGPDLAFDKLIRFGYMPEVVPPMFNTQAFADHLQKSKIVEEVCPKRTHATVYNATKRGNQRRTFSFPHPEVYHDTALFLTKNWQAVAQHCSGSKFSKSFPQPALGKNRAISITPNNELTQILYRELAGCRFVAVTDISRFYPSIYAHSIPWSVHGKAASKKDTKSSSLNLPFNSLDWLVRQSQDGQTIGLAVGPDASRIIAEIVAVGVDKLLAKAIVKSNVVIIRHVDDVWIGASSIDEAERCLHNYRECLRSFSLDINEHKTRVVEAVNALDIDWARDIKSLIGNEFALSPKEDQVSMLSYILRRSKDEHDDAIVRYAIRRLDREKLWASHWQVLEGFLIRAIVSFPHSIDYVARVLSWVKRSGNFMQVEKWNTVINTALTRNAGLGNDTEVCWLLWSCYELGIKVPSKLYNLILDRCGAFPIVMMFYLYPRCIKNSKLRKDKILEIVGANPFYGPFWLLAYEAAVAGWLHESELSTSGLSRLLKAMLADKVSFFDISASPLFMRNEEGKRHHLNGFAIEDAAGRYDDDDDDDDDSGDFSKRNLNDDDEAPDDPF